MCPISISRYPTPFLGGNGCLGRMLVLMFQIGARFRNPRRRPPWRPPAISRDDDRRCGRRPRATWRRLRGSAPVRCHEGSCDPSGPFPICHLRTTDPRSRRTRDRRRCSEACRTTNHQVPCEGGIPAAASEERGSLAAIQGCRTSQRDRTCLEAHPRDAGRTADRSHRKMVRKLSRHSSMTRDATITGADRSAA